MKRIGGKMRKAKMMKLGVIGLHVRRAKTEGDAIDLMHIIGPVQPRRIRKSHGENHRTIG